MNNKKRKKQLKGRWGTSNNLDPTLKLNYPKLRDFMTARFALADLSAIMFDLRLKPDEFPEPFTERLISLLDLLERRGMTHLLLEWMKRYEAKYNFDPDWLDALIDHDDLVEDACDDDDQAEHGVVEAGHLCTIEECAKVDDMMKIASENRMVTELGSQLSGFKTVAAFGFIFVCDECNDLYLIEFMSNYPLF